MEVKIMRLSGEELTLNVLEALKTPGGGEPRVDGGCWRVGTFGGKFQA